MDDGERWATTTHLIGLAFLETLNCLDQAKKLTPTSPEATFKDLGLVMSLYLVWGLEIEGMGADEEEQSDWRKQVIAYAKKAGIDLVEEGCFGMSETLETYKKSYGNIAALKDATKGQTNMRWKWRKFVSIIFISAYYLSILSI